MITTGRSNNSASRQDTYLSCPRKYAFDEVFPPNPVDEPSYFTRGTVVHILIASNLTGEDGDANVAAWLKEKGLTYDKNGVADAFEIFGNYMRCYDGDRIYKAYCKHVEYEVTYPMNGMTRRIDLVIEDPKDGLIYFVDHKVYSRFTVPTVFEEAARDKQFIDHWILGHSTFPGKFGGVIANIMSGDLARPKYIRDFVRVSPQSAMNLYNVRRSHPALVPPTSYEEALTFPAFYPNKCTFCSHLHRCP